MEACARAVPCGGTGWKPVRVVPGGYSGVATGRQESDSTSAMAEGEGNHQQQQGMDDAAKNEWRTFFQVVEDQVPTDIWLEPVFRMLHQMRCRGSSDLAFLSERDIEQTAEYGQLQIDHKNFFKKMMFVARQTNEVRTRYAETNGASSGGRSNPPDEVLNPMLSMVGADASAASMATAVAAAVAVETKSKKELMEAVGIYGLKNSLIPDERVWKLMMASKKLKRVKHKGIERTFLSVDLASLEMLPSWMPKSAVQGRVAQQDVRPDADPNLVSLANSIMRQTTTRRQLQSITQWMAIFMRWATVAVAAGMVSWGFILTHINTIMKIAEEQRVAGKPQCKAWWYCAQARKTWDEMDANEVEDFDLMEQAASVQKGIMEVVETKMAMSGILDVPAVTSRPSPSVVPPAAGAGDTRANNLAAESCAEAERRRAVRAAERIAEQSRAQASREAAMLAARNGWEKPPEASNSAWKEAIYQSSRGEPYGSGKGGSKGKSGKGSDKGGKGKGNNGKGDYGKWKGSSSSWKAWGSR